MFLFNFFRFRCLVNRFNNFLKNKIKKLKILLRCLQEVGIAFTFSFQFFS